jgi:ATP-dependent DNA ligase
MFQAFEFCIPIRSTVVRDGTDWIHEIKYDGFRLRVERNGDWVRLITRARHPRQTSQRPLLVKADIEQPYEKTAYDPFATFGPLGDLRLKLMSRHF